eukprot:GHVU01110767.1.p1 GENE.GHVU01110767.1~~GHVU01110767.1.p1  ORF type:complete len:229 (-),score=21.40 GHVU01110767.1:310-996(-)
MKRIDLATVGVVEPSSDEYDAAYFTLYDYHNAHLIRFRISSAEKRFTGPELAAALRTGRQFARTSAFHERRVLPGSDDCDAATLSRDILGGDPVLLGSPNQAAPSKFFDYDFPVPFGSVDCCVNGLPSHAFWSHNGVCARVCVYTHSSGRWARTAWPRPRPAVVFSRPASPTLSANVHTHSVSSLAMCPAEGSPVSSRRFSSMYVRTCVRACECIRTSMGACAHSLAR